MGRWTVLGVVMIVVSATDSSFAQQAAPSSTTQPAAGRARYDYIAIRGSGGPATVSDAKNVGTRAGTVTNVERSDIAGGGGAAIGFDWQKFGWSVRTELEYNLTFRFDYDSRPPLSSNPGFGFENNLKTHAFMLNAYYDIRNKTRWTPYLSLGVGLARNISEATLTELAEVPGKRQQNREDAKNSLALSGGIGARYALHERWSLEAGYRFLYLGKARTGPFFDGTAIEYGKYIKHDFLLGVAFHF